MSRRATAPALPSDDTSVPPSPDQRWRQLFGSEPPKYLASLVSRAVAWKEQVDAEGDVAPAIQHDLRIFADQIGASRAARQGRLTAAIDGPAAAVQTPASLDGLDASSPLLDSSSRTNHCGTGVATSPPPPTTRPAPGSPRANSASRTIRAVAPLPPASSQLTIGTRLVKEHGGTTHVVEVTDRGMLYDGQLFGSLSAVAKHITGTHWNGLLFFGLRRRKHYDRSKGSGR